MSDAVPLTPPTDPVPVIPPTPAPRFPWLSKLLPIVLAVLGLFVGIPMGAVMFGAAMPGCNAPQPDPTPPPSKYPTVTLPAKIAVPRTDHIFYVRLTTDAVNVTWQIPDGLEEQPDVVTKAGVKALTATKDTKDGPLYIRVWGAKGNYPSNLAVSEVTVGNTPPGPVPPVPPVPPPTPTDPFTKAVTDAWAKEAMADKGHVGELAQLYRQSIQTAQDKSIPTAKALHDQMKAARVALMGEALPNVRAVLQAELDATLPRGVTAPLDDATRSLCAKEFGKAADALTTLK